MVSRRVIETTYLGLASSFFAQSRLDSVAFGFSRHLGPGVLHKLVGPAPEEHRSRRVHHAGPVAEHLVVGDHFAVVATPVQRKVKSPMALTLSRLRIRFKASFYCGAECPSLSEAQAHLHQRREALERSQPG